MKVLHVIHSLAGGGAERQLCEMLKYAQNTTMNMAVFCVNGCNKESELTDCSVFVLSDASNYPWGLVGEIDDAIGEFKPDLMHCWLPVPVIVPAMIAAKKNRLPIIASYRNKKVFNGVYDIIEYMSVKLMASAVVSNNPPEQSNKAFQKLFDKKVSAYIPNSISTECTTKNHQRSQHEENKFTILFVGRIFDAQKNWRTLLEALGLIQSNVDWRLLICGDGKEKAELVKEVQRKGLDKQVDILGYREDVYSLMASADVLVFPSWYEGMPNVVVEAMALSLPCVISRIPAHEALFGDEAGVSYIDPAMPSMLAKVLEDMLSGTTNLQAMAQQGLNFSNRFTPEKLMQRYEFLYQQTLDLKIRRDISA
ncbi:glycosyltransferase [Pseudomonadales bacterium]|nr:glycosyltransferase [Pseudomonadales bacterium]MDB4363117.1 glycosyltransferase [Pseudomonadales bacterium]